MAKPEFKLRSFLKTHALSYQVVKQNRSKAVRQPAPTRTVLRFRINYKERLGPGSEGLDGAGVSAQQHPGELGHRIGGGLRLCWATFLSVELALDLVCLAANLCSESWFPFLLPFCSSSWIAQGIFGFMCFWVFFHFLPCTV